MKQELVEEQASIFYNTPDLKGQLFTLYLQYFFCLKPEWYWSMFGFFKIWICECSCDLYTSWKPLLVALVGLQYKTD